MKKQLPLPFKHTIVFDQLNYVETPSNRTAHQWINLFPDWPSNGLILQGEPGSGKTHLAHIWQQRVGALYITGELTEKMLEQVIERPNHVVLDALDFSIKEQEQHLFHLYNALKTAKKSMLILARTPLNTWGIQLPDLSSRLQTLSVVRIDTPDDELLCGIFLKRFSDAQMTIDQRTIHYLLTHTDRSYKSLNHWVDLLQETTLEHHRKITIPLIKSLQESAL